MKNRALFLAIFLGWLVPTFAVDQQFGFALPELEGRISLGVFDASDKLVRTLFVGATDANFTIGVNGLITTWDGKNDAGAALPAGKYHVRGFVVGEEVKSEGEAFHFNDWVSSEESPRIASPQVVGTAGSDVLIAGSQPGADGVVCRYGEDSELRAVATLPAHARFIGGAATSALFDTENGSLYILDYEHPEKSRPLGPDPQGFSSAALWQGKTYLAPSFGSPTHQIRAFAAGSLPEGAGEIKSPADLRWLDANGAGVVASDGHGLWVFRGQDFIPVPTSGELAISSLSAGVGETFWIVGQPVRDGIKGGRFVRQYSFAGQVLRQLAGDYTAIFADKLQERIFLTQSPDAATTVIKGLRPLPKPPGGGAKSPKVADWEVFLDQTSSLCGNFGLVDNQLVADAGITPQKDSWHVKLAPSELSPEGRELDGRICALGKEIWIETKEGLRLGLVGLLPGADRCVVSPDGESLKVYAGNGAMVAEYRVTGLKQIAEIDAGEIDLP